MTIKTEVLRILNAKINGPIGLGSAREELADIRDRIAALPEGEPIGYVYTVSKQTAEENSTYKAVLLRDQSVKNGTPVYAAPPTQDTEDAARLARVREIYAGMDGFIPQTAAEGYCLKIIKDMAHAAMGVDAAPPTQDAEDAARLNGYIRREVERAIDEAVNPKGMAVHNGMARIGADKLQYLLKFIDAARRKEE